MKNLIKLTIIAKKEIVNKFYKKFKFHYFLSIKITIFKVDKNSLCQTLFDGRIRTTNVILPNYGSAEILETRNQKAYIERQKQFREEKEEKRVKESLKAGNGNLFDKKISRVTVPKRTLLFSDNALSLREVKNSIRSLKKPIAPHKFQIGFQQDNFRKNPFRISKNIMLTSDEAD